MKTLSYDSLMNQRITITKTLSLDEECQRYVIVILLQDGTIVEYYDEQLFKYKNSKEYEDACGMTVEDIPDLEKAIKIVERTIRKAFEAKGNFNIKLIRLMEK